MSSIPGSSSFPHPGLDAGRTQVAFDQPQGLAQDPALDLQGLQSPAAAPVAATDAGTEILKADAWTGDGPRRFSEDPALGQRFQSLSLVDASTQAADVIAEPLDAQVAVAA